MFKLIVLMLSISSVSVFASGYTAWESSVLDPVYRKVSFDVTGINFAKDTLSRGKLVIENRGASCSFDQLQNVSFNNWRKDCQLAIQMLASAEKHIKIAKTANLYLPGKIIIEIQKPDGACFAMAGLSENRDLGEIEFCPAEEEQLDDYLKYSSEILFHEMAHLTLKNKLLSNYILSSGQEDFATIYSYFLSGQTNFTIPEDAIYNSSVQFGHVSPGNYGSLIALTSALIDIQKHSFTYLKSNTSKERFLNFYTKLIETQFFKIQPGTTQQSFLNSWIAEVTNFMRIEYNLSARLLKSKFSSIVLLRGLDLAEQNYDGILSTILVNSNSFAVPAKIIADRSSSANLKKPIITLHDPSGALEYKPLKGFIMDLMAFTTEVTACLNTSTIPDFKERYYRCFEIVTAKPLIINSLEIDNRVFELAHHGDSYVIEHSGSLPPVGQFAIPWIFVFDDEMNQLFNFTALVGTK